MRILHVSESLDPAHGGTPAVPKALAAAQVGLGHEATILTRDEPGRAEAIRESMAGIPNADRVTIASVGAGGARDRFVNRAAAAWATEHGGRFDFAHLHSMWSPIPHGAARGLERARVPYTLCPHGMLDEWAMEQKRAKKMLHLMLASRRTMKRSVFAHALSGYERTCIEPFGFGVPIEVIGNGVQPDQYESIPDPGVFRAAHPEVGDRPYVIFLGRLHFGKGIDLVARGFARIACDHPESRLVLVGPDAGAKAGIESAAQEVGIADRVVFTGPVYGREKLAALAGAVCYCLPSEHEGFSVAICEALACGTPVVISPECHFDEVGTEGAGVIVPRDPAEIGDAVGAMLADPDRARAMGEAGRTMVFEKFTWPAVAQRCVDLYRKHGARSS